MSTGRIDNETVNKLTEEQKRVWEKVWRAFDDISNCLRVETSMRDSSIVLAAYFLSRISQYNNPFGISYQNIVEGYLDEDESIILMAKSQLNEQVWEKLKGLVAKYEPNVFTLVSLLQNKTAAEVTPDSLIELSLLLLDIQPDDCVADIGCGGGDFIMEAAKRNPTALCYGYEIATETKAIAAIRAKLSSGKVQIHQCDAFELVNGDNEANLRIERFDKIFSNYPFGMRLRNLGAGQSYLEQITAKFPDISKATSSDWVYNSLLVDLIKPTGKAVGIMTNGSTWNSIDRSTREFFIKNGLIECVVALPERLFYHTNIPTTIVVLSHGNKQVRLVDASELYQRGRRQNELSDENIATIFDACKADSEYSKIVSNQELSENDYVLNPGRYFSESVTFENGVSFESIIKNITRGAPSTADQLDAMASAEETNMQYLMLANIHNGLIDEKLPYLTHIDDKYEKYCLKNNCLLLSKNGYPYKVAVAHVKEVKRILANGNLYIIELDEEKANTYYIKAFLESEKGITLLKSITVGATIPNIGVEKLKGISIPLPSMKEQELIANKYLATLDEIEVIKLKLDKAMSRLSHIFDVESEG